MSGRLRFGLYDNRQNSPTYQMLNVFTVSNRHRALVVIPRGVYHGIENVGTAEALYLDIPDAAVRIMPSRTSFGCRCANR